MYQSYYRVKLYVCGSFFWKLRKGAIAFIVFDKDGFKLDERHWSVYNTTTHRASYKALSEGLEFVRRYRPALVDCYLENKLVVYQAKEWWAIHNHELRKLWDAVVRNEKYFKKVYYNLVKSIQPEMLEVHKFIDRALGGDENKELRFL